MTAIKRTDTRWDPEKKLVVTHISGDLEKSDIERWEEGFKNTLGKIEGNATFKIFVNMHGFRAVSLEAHKRFRSVIPSTLADYGWKVGFVDLFKDEAKAMTFHNTRGIQCMGAAHVHQDKAKMDLYEMRFGSDRERFFHDPAPAKQWIEKLEVIEKGG